MFKTYKALCSCHKQERWILNKKGECNETIRQKRTRKMPKRSKIQPNRNAISGGNYKFKRKCGQINSPIKKISEKKLQRNRDGFGEATFFKKIFEEALQKKYPDCPQCACCGAPLGFEARTFLFSHVLAKSTYPLFRLWKSNIWLCCLTCHSEWDQGDRNQSKFVYKRKVAEALKQFYYKIKDLIDYELPEKFEI